MDVIQILVFLGIIGWGLFQARTQKQKKPKRVKTVRQAPPAASFSVEEEVPEEVISAPVPRSKEETEIYFSQTFHSERTSIECTEKKRSRSLI